MRDPSASAGEIRTSSLLTLGANPLPPGRRRAVRAILPGDRRSNQVGLERRPIRARPSNRVRRRGDPSPMGNLGRRFSDEERPPALKGPCGPGRPQLPARLGENRFPPFSEARPPRKPPHSVADPGPDLAHVTIRRISRAFFRDRPPAFPNPSRASSSKGAAANVGSFVGPMEEGEGARAAQRPVGGAWPPKPKPFSRDSLRRGLSPRRHTPISAARSETRSRPQGRDAARLLLSSAGFASFRAPIDSVMDPGGQPWRPTDPFLSLRCGFGPLRGWKNEAVDSEVMLQ